ncbi:hypothetical protein ABLG96_10875 [Nakamurella sp. A5-74]|uniref:Uncharacterized protein n=1 Tax=Nakamurella sp. A5-74 TaxID=3158264 RepID=A0AAU8DWX8_9ACTN
MTPTRTYRSAAVLGVAGGVLGILAGLVQLSFGSRIGTWGGQKTDPVGLGLLTMMLGAVAVASALVLVGGRRRSPTLPSPERRAGVSAGLGIPALLCFTTVGSLWYLPGIVLLTATVLIVLAGDRHALRAAIASDWLSALLTLLGAFVLMMALTAAPVTTIVGVIGGLVVMTGAWLPVRRPVRMLLVAAGTLPFAVLTWWTLLTPALAVLALVVAAAASTSPAALTRSRPRAPAAV